MFRERGSSVVASCNSEEGARGLIAVYQQLYTILGLSIAKRMEQKTVIIGQT